MRTDSKKFFGNLPGDIALWDLLCCMTFFVVVNNPFEDYVILDNWSTYLFLINIVLKY